MSRQKLFMRTYKGNKKCMGVGGGKKDSIIPSLNTVL